MTRRRRRLDLPAMKENEVPIGVYITAEIHDRLVEEAKRRGITIADVLREWIAKYETTQKLEGK